MNWKKIVSLGLSAALAVSLAAPAMAADLPEGWTPADGARTSEPWYAEAQTYVTEKGIMTGTDKGFEPEKVVTRAEVYQTLWNMAGSPVVEAPTEHLLQMNESLNGILGVWFTNSARWAYQEGLTTGVEGGRYEGDRAVTRSELASIFARYAQMDGWVVDTTDSAVTAAPDYDKVPAWGAEDAAFCYELGLMTGDQEGRLNPLSTATRATLATMLMNLDSLVPAYIESVVSYESDGRTVPAIVTVPGGEGPFPAVVLNHGHGGSKDENVGFGGVAQALALAGFASIRMDFPGCGDSEASFQDNTMTNMIADSNAGLAYLLENYDIDESRLGILGYSMGGRIASQIVGTEANPYKAVVLLSAANGDADGDLAVNLFGSLDVYNELKATAEKEGFATFTTIYGQTQELSKAWFEDMESGKPQEDLAKFAGPVLVLHGDVDTMITDEMNKDNLAACQNGVEVIVPGADHGYGFYSDQPEVTAMVEGSIVDFFAANLYETTPLAEYLEGTDEEWFLTGKKEYTIQGMMVSKDTPYENVLEGNSGVVTNDRETVLLKGTVDELWPAKLDKVSSTYTTADGKDVTRSTFSKKDTYVDLKTKAEPDTNYAMFIPADTRVVVETAWGETLVANRPGVEHGAGDYLVCAIKDGQPDLSDVWVVNGAIFPNTYDLSHKGITGAVTAVSKYGNIGTDITVADFAALGFEVGDVVTVTVNGQSVDAPYGTGYSNVDTGNVIVLADTSNDTIATAINMGNFAGTYGAAEGTEITYSMKEKAGYLEEYTIRNIDILRTNVREDYDSDEIFANFRPVTMGDIAEGKLYRGSSPVNPELGRNTYVDDLLKANGIKTVIDLADSEEAYEGYEGVKDSYAYTTNTVKLDMGVDFAAEDFAAKLKTGLEYMLANEGPYFVHCNEGKDRCGFVSMVLEMLMGGKLDEIVDDYMLSYENYYHVEKDSDRWNRIADSNVISNLLKLTGAEDKEALAEADLVKAAETYLTETVGLTAEQVAGLKDTLSK